MYVVTMAMTCCSDVFRCLDSGHVTQDRINGDIFYFNKVLYDAEMFISNRLIAMSREPPPWPKDAILSRLSSIRFMVLL